MKNLFVIIAVLFVAHCASAQTVTGVDAYKGTLINRIDRQENLTPLNGYSAQPLFETPRAITVTTNEPRVAVTPGDITYQKILIKNNTDSTLILNVYRKHLHLPMKWTSSICSPVTCYPAGRDTLPEFVFAPGAAPVEYILNIYCPTLSFVDSIVDELVFVVKTGNINDSVHGTYVGALTPVDGVEPSKTISIQSKILSVYPSPLIDGNSIRVKINSPREQNFTYSIMDEIGKEVAFGSTHQRLTVGENTCQIGELNGLAKGNYILKFTFADGTADTRMFQVAR